MTVDPAGRVRKETANCVLMIKYGPWEGKKQMDETRPPWRDSKGRFVPGNPGLPGRPKGSRNLLADAMIDDLYKDWLEHGIQAIRAARESRPVEYLKVVAVIVSKCGDLSLADEMRDAAVEQFIEERRQKALLAIEKMRGGGSGPGQEALITASIQPP